MIGQMEKLVRVNLSTRKVTWEELSAEFLRKYLGGWGIVGYCLLKEVPKGIDPLGPENKLIVTCGLLTGLPLAGAARTIIGSKSPLTGGFSASEVGGFFGAEFRKTGIFSLIIEGRSNEPVYLYINDGQVEIYPASHLSKLRTHEVQKAIRDEHGDSRIRVAQAGIAGANLAKIACIIIDANRAAGRGGLGAVMGSKNLKAIAVRGTGKLEPKQPQKLAELAKYMAKNWKSVGWLEALNKHGTDSNIPGLSYAGGLPTRNFLDGSFEEAEAISGEAMTSRILKDRDTCWACPIRCKRVVEVHGRYDVDPVYGGPEYETVGALGSCCGIGDLEAIAKGSELCNAYGLDTISTGVTISWAMECYERGILTKEDTDGIEFKFGNADAMLKAIELIATRAGFGALLAEGSWRAARRIGRGSEEFVMHSKKQELPMHEPRIKFGLGIGYATSPTGADHCHNIHDTGFASAQGIKDANQFGIFDPLPATDLSPEKLRLTRYVIDWRAAGNCLGTCLFLPWNLSQIRDIVNAFTDWNMSDLEIMKAGERALTMARAFNAREGFTKDDDTIPARFHQKFDKAPADGIPIDPEVFRKALDTYYAIRNWDIKTGHPTEGLLIELGLAWVADLLKQG